MFGCILVEVEGGCAGLGRLGVTLLWPDVVALATYVPDVDSQWPSLWAPMRSVVRHPPVSIVRYVLNTPVVGHV